MADGPLSEQSPRERWKPYSAGILVLIVAVFAVFGASIFYGFVFIQDDVNITDQAAVTFPSFHHLIGIWRDPASVHWRPVAHTFWSFIGAFAGSSGASGSRILSPAPFHAANLIIHALNVGLVFNLLLVALNARLRKAAIWPAVAGALVFAWHPIQVEAVAWVSGFPMVLSAFFSLFGIWQFLLGEARRTLSLPRKTLEREFGIDRDFWPRSPASAFAIASIAVALGILTDPSAAAAPLLASVMAMASFGVTRPRCRLAAGSVVAGVLWLLITCPPLSLSAAINALGHGFWKLLLPFSLNVDYLRSAGEATSKGIAWFSVGVLLAGTGFLLKRRTQGVFAGSAALFLLGYLPSSGFANDHSFYLALLGPSMALGYAFAVWPKRVEPLGAAALAVWAALSFAQVGVWKNNLSLFRHAVAGNPENAQSQMYLGLALCETDDIDQGVKHLEEAIRLGYPEPATVQFHLASAMMRKRAFSAALNYLSLARARQPGNPEIYLNLGVVHSQMGKVSESISNYLRALELRPGWPEAHFNLARAYADSGKPAEAIRQLDMALMINPEFSEAKALARTLRDNGKEKGK